MTESKWSVISAIIAIVVFVIPGLAFAYQGFKKWKQAEATEISKVKWGRFEFFLGIGLFVAAVVFVICLIIFIRNGTIVRPPKDEGTESPSVTESSSATEPSGTTELSGATESQDTAGLSDVTESPTPEPGHVYVSHQIYRGSDYSGYVNELRQPDGEGTMKYLDGSVYTGNWVDGVRQGHGKMTYDNGTYDGEWLNDKKNGEGKYTWNDGRIYEGGYLDDVRSGCGTFYGWEDLTRGYKGTYYGESKNDKFNGSGHFVFDNGDEFDGIYKDNLYWTGTYTMKGVGQFEVVDGQIQ